MRNHDEGSGELEFLVSAFHNLSRFPGCLLGYGDESVVGVLIKDEGEPYDDYDPDRVRFFRVGTLGQMKRYLELLMSLDLSCSYQEEMRKLLQESERREQVYGRKVKHF